MIPLFVPAITLAGAALVTKYASDSRSDSNKPRFMFRPLKMEPGKVFTLRNPVKSLMDTFASSQNPFKNLMSGAKNRPNPIREFLNRAGSRPNPLKNLFNGADTQNPIKNIFSGLTSTVSQLTGKSGEEYNNVLKRFIPGEAEVLTPQYPSNSKKYLVADIDGNSRNELITTYKQNNEMKTLILRKENGAWGIADEIVHPSHESLHYRGLTDITGNGKKQLLFGMTNPGQPSKLYGYTYDDNKPNQVFEQDYHKFEVVKHSKSPKACFAVWNRKDSDSYDINVLQWNGTQLEPVQNTTGYYLRSVVTHYANQVKKNPRSPAGWYHLADSLSKAGERRDALAAIDEGSRFDKDSVYTERFSTLKERLKKG